MRPGAALLLVTAAIIVAAYAILPATAPAPPLHQAKTIASRPVTEPSRPTITLQPALTLPVRTHAVDAAGEDDRPGAFAGPLRLAPPYVVLDSASFSTKDATIRLAFVAGLPRDAVCLDAAQRRYACGLRGRASLVKLIAGQPVTCWRAFGARQAGSVPGGDEDPRYQCFVGSQDVARGQVAAGFARAVSPAFNYERDEQAAKNAASAAADDLGLDGADDNAPY